MPRRTWTEEEIQILKENYATMSQDDLIRLHFQDKTKDSVKWQIERQGLAKKDYFSDEEIETIKILRRNRVPTKYIGKLLHRSENSIRIKCTKLGIVSQNRYDLEDSDLSNNQSLLNRIDNKLVGTINEEFVRIKLALEGYDLAIPYMNNHKTDLYIIFSNIIVKIQIKSAVYDTQNKRFRASLRTKNRIGEHIAYSPKDVDFFIVKCNGIDAYYVLPFTEVEKEHYANLYPHRAKMQIKGFDFEKYKNRFDIIKNYGDNSMHKYNST